MCSDNVSGGAGYRCASRSQTILAPQCLKLTLCFRNFILLDIFSGHLFALRPRTIECGRRIGGPIRSITLFRCWSGELALFGLFTEKANRISSLLTRRLAPSPVAKLDQVCLIVRSLATSNKERRLARRTPRVSRSMLKSVTTGNDGA